VVSSAGDCALGSRPTARSGPTTSSGGSCGGGLGQSGKQLDGRRGQDGGGPAPDRPTFAIAIRDYRLERLTIWGSAASKGGYDDEANRCVAGGVSGDRVQRGRVLKAHPSAGRAPRVAALDSDILRELPRTWAQGVRRAIVVLEAFLGPLNHKLESPTASSPDVFDPSIRNKKTLDSINSAASSISRKCGIVTALQPRDFAQAIRAASASHP